MKGGDRMWNNSTKPDEDIETIIRDYGDMLFRICFLLLGNTYDTEDVIQDTMIKYISKAPNFQSKEYQKAWLIKVATNQCKDILRYRTNHQMVNLDDIQEITSNSEQYEIMECLMNIPEKFRIILILHYIEGYSTKEISKMIGKTDSCVKMRLSKGRKLLKDVYQKEVD